MKYIQSRIQVAEEKTFKISDRTKPFRIDSSGTFPVTENPYKDNVSNNNINELRKNLTDIHVVLNQGVLHEVDKLGRY